MEEKIAGNAGTYWINAKYIQDHLMVGKTRSHEIIKEIQANKYAPDAVVKFDASKPSSGVRVRKDIFHQWVRERGTGDDDRMFSFIPNLANVYSLSSRRRETGKRLIG